MIGFIRPCFIDPFEIVLRKLTQLDYPSYFSELYDEHDDADPIEFDAGELLFGNSCFIDGHGGGRHSRWTLSAQRERKTESVWYNSMVKGLDDVVFLGLKIREELKRVTSVTSCDSKLLREKLTTSSTVVNVVLEVGNDHVYRIWVQDPHVSVLYVQYV